MEMGQRIKERRLAMGYTQEELACKLGLQKSAIAKYENGRVENIKRTVILKMATILECSPTYLMGWDIHESCIERIKSTCIEKNIPLSKLEKDLGFVSGYISQSRSTTLPMDKLQKISGYLGKPVDYFISEEETEASQSKAIPKEFEDVMLKYQFIAEHSPKGKEAVDYTLNREYDLAKMIYSKIIS